jgi:hypothetical protein
MTLDQFYGTWIGVQFGFEYEEALLVLRMEYARRARMPTREGGAAHLEIVGRVGDHSWLTARAWANGMIDAGWTPDQVPDTAPPEPPYSIDEIDSAIEKERMCSVRVLRRLVRPGMERLWDIDVEKHFGILKWIAATSVRDGFTEAETRTRLLGSHFAHLNTHRQTLIDYRHHANYDRIVADHREKMINLEKEREKAVRG